ncbi:cytochrome P450 [Lentinula aciculospora]|uniref:Cytochrome P450 n=1 Tax=Lentinula aciculospora TaxID=153920 RepID=A0A9W9A968_9AGAR|nr:cytochrome P450 [Lentinula aciculospora]
MLRQTLILAALVFPVVVFLRKRNPRLRLPPGPKPLPVIGNVLEIPTERSWIKYAEWGRMYGDVIHITAFRQSIIILNSAKAIFDLLERKGGIYADRPRMVMAGDLVGWNNSPFLGQSGPRHKEYRRLFAEVLSARKVEEWRPLQQAKVIQLAAQLLKSPDAFRAHIKSHVGNLIFEISHGHIVKDEKDALLSVAQQVDHDFAEMVVPGAFLVDIFPILRHIPVWTGVSFKQKAKQYRETLSAALEWPYRQVKDQIAAGTALPSFTTGLVERKENATEEEEFNWKWASLGFVLAGSDTASLSASISGTRLTSFVLAMSLHPEVQRKAQAEIDYVVGTSRLPTFLDRPNMPYVEGVIREVYRWNPVGPIASPHRLTQEADDVYRNWTIPKGSVVIANSWGVMHDPDVYPDPFEFNPERYTLGTTSDGIRVWNDALSIDQMVNPDPRKFAFGYGRRICPGQLLADDTVFMGVVTLLALFDVGPLTSGEPPQYTPNVIRYGGT